MKINNLEIKIFKDKAELYKEAANEVLEVIKKEKKPIISFATGGTPKPLYELLIKYYQQKIADFSNLTSFNLDEYLGVSEDNINSYSYYMYNNLFNHININPKNINLIKGDAKNIKREIKRYQKLLKKNKRHLQILGIGSDGHIAFNEPGTDPNLGVHIIKLDQQTINDNARFFDNDIEKVPKEAITMGISDILYSDRIILIATGKNKAAPILQMIRGSVNNLLPASHLRNHDNVCIYLDSEASNSLKL